MLLALVFYPVCYFIAQLILLICFGNIVFLYCWPPPNPLPYMTPGSNYFSEWQHARSSCAPSSQLQATFRNIQDYLLIILPFAVSYLIACAIMTAYPMAKKKGQKKGRMSDFLFIILVITIIALFVLIGWQAFAGLS
jgi:hypothetical protein